MLKNDDNVEEYSRTGFKLNEEQEEKDLKQREHVTASNETGETPLSSVAFSDTFSISPERDMSHSKTPHNEEMQMEQKKSMTKERMGIKTDTNLIMRNQSQAVKKIRIKSSHMKYCKQNL